jgi:hypothetical protein
MARDESRELALRIVVMRPPAGVALRVQRGRDELVPPSRETADELAFDVRVRSVVLADDGHTLRGEVVQGPPTSRFVYVCIGTMAGQPDSPWSRRAKVSLMGITRALADAALAEPGAVLEVRYEGTDRRGTPACASVPLPDGWRIVRDEPQPSSPAVPDTDTRH